MVVEGPTGGGGLMRIALKIQLRRMQGRHQGLICDVTHPRDISLNKNIFWVFRTLIHTGIKNILASFALRKLIESVVCFSVLPGMASNLCRG